MSEIKPKPPRQTAAHAAARMFHPGPGILNVGDLAAEVDGCQLVSATAWKGTRAEFAAAFAGVAASHHDPKRPSRQNGPFPSPAVAWAGGSWEFEVRGEPKPGDLLGPAIAADGKLLPWALEPVGSVAEAVAVAGDKPGAVRLFAGAGEAPDAPADDDE